MPGRYLGCVCYPESVGKLSCFITETRLIHPGSCRGRRGGARQQGRGFAVRLSWVRSRWHRTTAVAVGWKRNGAFIRARCLRPRVRVRQGETGVGAGAVMGKGWTDTALAHCHSAAMLVLASPNSSALPVLLSSISVSIETTSCPANLLQLFPFM